MKYEFNSDHKQKQAWRNITEAKGRGVVSHVKVKRWFGKFKNEEKELPDKPWSGRPPSLDDVAVLATFDADMAKSTLILSADFYRPQKQIVKIFHKVC